VERGPLAVACGGAIFVPCEWLGTLLATHQQPQTRGLTVSERSAALTTQWTGAIYDRVNEVMRVADEEKAKANGPFKKDIFAIALCSQSII
jgi:hypothetical protein